MAVETRRAHTDQWKQRFRAPRILWTQRAAQRPERGLLATNRSGTMQLYAWDVPSGELTQLTRRLEGTNTGYLSPSGEYVYYFDDEGGNEVGHFRRLPFGGGGEPLSDEPRDISPDLPPFSAGGLSCSRDAAKLGFIGADPSGFHVYLMDVNADGMLGERREIGSSQSLTFGPLLSYAGEVAIIATAEKSERPEMSLVAIDPATGERFAELWDGQGTNIQPAGFSPLPGDLRLLASTDASGVRRPLIWNPRTGERRDLPLPDLEGEVVPADWSPDARRVLLVQTANAVQRLYLYDLENDSLTALDHPAGVLMFFVAPYFTPEGEIFVHWQDAAHPLQLIALDAETGRQTRVVLEAGEVPAGRSFRSISFTGALGDTIQGWLAVPEGDGPFPTVLETHGGPEAAMLEMFHPAAQMWLDAGFAFLTINFHGSTTFGKEFQESIWGNPGFLEVEDMVAARNWLVEKGIARPDAIFLTGWSYGGYLTLQALGREPDIWAGGMAGVAIADWTAQYEDSMEIIKAYQRAFFGGSPEEKAEQYRASSPITYVDRVQAPVIVIQGRNDARCPARPMEMYETRMRELGKPIEIEWFQAGHVGSAMNVEESVKHHGKLLAFAQNVVAASPDA